MGWTSLYRDRGMSHKAFFENEFSSIEIMDTHQAKNVVYMKCRSKKNGTKFAMVVLFQWTKGHYNFTYKDMDETMGPCECSCPLRIIEGLDPPVGEYAAEWRRRVREYNADRQPAPKIGQTIKLAVPLKFSNGYIGDTFTVVRFGKRGRAYRNQDGQLFRIVGLNGRKFSVVSPQAPAWVA